MGKGILKSPETSRSVEALDLCWGDIEIYTFPVGDEWPTDWPTGMEKSAFTRGARGPRNRLTRVSLVLSRWYTEHFRRQPCRECGSTHFDWLEAWKQRSCWRGILRIPSPQEEPQTQEEGPSIEQRGTRYLVSFVLGQNENAQKHCNFLTNNIWFLLVVC